MECIRTSYDHEIIAGDDRTWYRPVEVNGLISNTFHHLQKVRTIGYLCIRNGDYYIQNLDSVFGSPKCQIRVLIDDLNTIPPMSPPQAVQIFGEVCYAKLREHDADTHSGEIESKVSNVEMTRRETIRIKAKLIQNIPPSIIQQMNEIVMVSSK